MSPPKPDSLTPDAGHAQAKPSSQPLGAAHVCLLHRLVRRRIYRIEQWKGQKVRVLYLTCGHKKIVRRGYPSGFANCAECS